MWLYPPRSYDRDWVGIGAPDTTTARYFNAAFVQFGGEDAVGLPRDNGGGAAMHRWGAGWIQDFGDGAYLPGALMMADGTTTPYWVYGGIWAQYSTVDHGAMGCHGYPTSVLTAFPNSGPDAYLRQNFQTGSIIWDATTKLVVADVCS